jgi:SAM-dependent methyltransferase
VGTDGAPDALWAGDIAFRLLRDAGEVGRGHLPSVTVCDINAEMLKVGQQRAGEVSKRGGYTPEPFPARLDRTLLLGLQKAVTQQTPDVLTLEHLGQVSRGTRPDEREMCVTIQVFPGPAVLERVTWVEGNAECLPFLMSSPYSIWDHSADTLGSDDENFVQTDFTMLYDLPMQVFSDPAVREKVTWVEGNAECLPFEDGAFDLYTIAFGLRNVTNRCGPRMMMISWRFQGVAGADYKQVGPLMMLPYQPRAGGTV